jgi:hypothetical protein
MAKTTINPPIHECCAQCGKRINITMYVYKYRLPIICPRCSVTNIWGKDNHLEVRK